MGKSIIPFGLRIKLFSHFKDPSQEFKKKWEEVLTNCSLSLMSLLINEHKAQLDLVDTELQSLNTNLSTFSSMEGFSAKDKMISHNLAKRSKIIITNKEKKLTRDQKAFSNNKAYV